MRFLMSSNVGIHPVKKWSDIINFVVNSESEHLATTPMPDVPWRISGPWREHLQYYFFLHGSMLQKYPGVLEINTTLKIHQGRTVLSRVRSQVIFQVTYFFLDFHARPKTENDVCCTIECKYGSEFSLAKHLWIYDPEIEECQEL